MFKFSSENFKSIFFWGLIRLDLILENWEKVEPKQCKRQRKKQRKLAVGFGSQVGSKFFGLKILPSPTEFDLPSNLDLKESSIFIAFGKLFNVYLFHKFLYFDNNFQSR